MSELLSAVAGGVLVAILIGLYHKLRSPVLISQHGIAKEFPELDGQVRWISEYDRLRYEGDAWKVVTKGLLRREVWSKMHPNRDVVLMRRPKLPTILKKPKPTVSDRAVRDILRWRRQRRRK